MEKHPVKQIKVNNHLKQMMKLNPDLFEKILDSNGFGYHFNEICLLAECGDKLILIKLTKRY